MLGAHLAQSLALAVTGTALGMLLALVVNVFGTRALAQLSPLALEAGLTWRASVQGAAIALLVTMLFALPALLEVRQVKPVLLFRRDTAPKHFDWLQVAARVLLIAVVIAVAMWQAGSYPRSRWFIGTVAVTAVGLNLAGGLLVAGLARIGRVRWLTARYAIGNLCRPGNQTKAVLFAVGIGTLFLVSVRQQQATFQTAFNLDLDGLTADMFAIDIQPDQRQAAEAVYPVGRERRPAGADCSHPARRA